MSDFAGQEYDFAAGSLFGLRGWDMDELGRLHGVTHRIVWTPGDNTSVCKATVETRCPGPSEPTVAHHDRLSEGAVQRKKFGRKKAQVEEPLAEWELDLLHGALPRRCGHPDCVDGRVHVGQSGHRFDASCQCGFWAYDEGGFAPHGTIIGVIEGFGKTTIGTKGFRCEKARIAALCLEGADGKGLSRSVVSRLSHLYPDAVWHLNRDAMVDAFDVVRTWPEVDEGFWLRRVPARPDDGYSSLWRSYTRGLYSGGYRSPFTFGGITS